MNKSNFDKMFPGAMSKACDFSARYMCQVNKSPMLSMFSGVGGLDLGLSQPDTQLQDLIYIYIKYCIIFILYIIKRALSIRYFFFLGSLVWLKRVAQRATTLAKLMRPCLLYLGRKLFPLFEGDAENYQ